MTQSPSPTPPPDGDPIGTVTIDGVWSRFATGPWVHRGVSLEVGRGESLAIVGGSGTGKSTLLKLLVGLLKPLRGKVVVDGIDVTEASENDLYSLMSRVGVLFQFGALFDSLTVAENVAFALQDRLHSPEKLRRAAKEKLKMVGLRGGIADLYPSQLSGGMRKRVALARAIANEPKMLFCDEPTSDLDPVMADTISELILQMKERLGVTVITITHSMSCAYKTADRIAMLYRGRILACDTPAGIRESPDPIVQQFIQGRATGPMSGLG